MGKPSIKQQATYMRRELELRRMFLQNEGQLGTEGILEGLKALIEPPSNLEPTPEPSISDPFPLTIDYAWQIEGVVEAGHYNGYVDSGITEENFPVVRLLDRAQLDVVLVGFGRNIENEEALTMMDKLGYRPAVLLEGLAFGAQHPEHQRRNPIVILGSVRTDPDGHRHVGCIGSHNGRRDLNLFLFEKWRPHYRFLFVRKSAKPVEEQPPLLRPRSKHEKERLAVADAVEHM